MAVYYLTMKNSGKSSSAVMKYDYNSREGYYKKGSKAEELIYKGSENMPEWGKNNPRYFWKMADEQERANANLFRKIEFSLPHELSEEENIKLANDYAKEMFGEDFPYSIAIHKKLNEEKTLDNVHCHIIFCERKMDGIKRNEELFFKRANSKNPEKGGAKKLGRDYWSKKETLYYVREKWEERLNEKLEEKGIEKVSCKSLVKQREEAIKQNDFLKAELLNREPINIDMIGSNKIKKHILYDEDLLLKAKFMLAKDIKIIKEEEYLEKIIDPRANDKAREEFIVKNIGSIDIESTFVIDKNLDTKIYKVEIERQIEKEETYKNIAFANKKIEEIEKQKDDIREKIKEFKKTIAVTTDPLKKTETENLLKEETLRSKKIFGMSNIYQKNIKELENKIKQLNEVTLDKVTINREQLQLIKKEFDTNAKEFNNKGDKKEFYKELNKIKYINNQIKETREQEKDNLIDKKISWLKGEAAIFNLDYKKNRENKEPEKIVDWDVVFKEKIVIKPETKKSIDKLELEFEKQILKDSLYKKVAKAPEKLKEKTMKQLEKLEKINTEMKPTKEDVLSYKNKLEIKIESLKDAKEILGKIPQTEETKKYADKIKKEYYKEIKKLKMTNKLNKELAIPEEIIMKNIKSKMERIDQINKKIVILEKKTDIKAIKTSVYDEITKGKYSKTLEEMKELKDLIKQREKNNAIRVIKDDTLLYDLKEKQKQYNSALDKFHVKNPVEEKVFKIREENIKKIDSLKTEKKSLIVDIKNTEKKSAPKEKKKIGSLLDLISEKEERFNKGYMDTSKVIETGNER